MLPETTGGSRYTTSLALATHGSWACECPMLRAIPVAPGETAQVKFLDASDLPSLPERHRSRRVNPMSYGHSLLPAQSLEERGRLAEVGGVKAFGAPATDRCQQRVGLSMLAWTGAGGTLLEPSRRIPEAQQPQQRAEPRALESERHQLTVLFCDLVDSTPLASSTQKTGARWCGPIRIRVPKSSNALRAISLSISAMGCWSTLAPLTRMRSRTPLHDRFPPSLQRLSMFRAFRLTPGAAWSADTPSHMPLSGARIEVPTRARPIRSPGRAGGHTHALPELWL
jgi:hypothetical protein